MGKNKDFSCFCHHIVSDRILPQPKVDDREPLAELERQFSFPVGSIDPQNLSMSKVNRYKKAKDKERLVFPILMEEEEDLE